MEFLKNPLQKKFIPVVTALLTGATFFAGSNDVLHRVMAVLCWGLIAASQVLTVDRPLVKAMFWLYTLTAAFFGALGTMCVIEGAVFAAVISFIWASFPLSIALTRPRKE